MPKTTTAPVYARRLRGLMREARWDDAQTAVHASISPRTVAQLRLGRNPTMRRATAQSLASAFAKKLGRAIHRDWVAGEREA